jgi:hypothetical protein
MPLLMSSSAAQRLMVKVGTLGEAFLALEE